MKFTMKLGSLASMVASILFVGCASAPAPIGGEGSGIVASIETEPRPFSPTLTVYNVMGTVSSIPTIATAVLLKFSKSEEEFALQSIGGNAWKVEFTPEKYLELRNSYSLEPMAAEVSIRAENGSGRMETHRRSIEVSLPVPVSMAESERPHFHAEIPHGRGARN